MWMIKSVTSYFFGTLECVAKKFVNSERAKLYQMGKYDFQKYTTFLVPLVSLVLLNAVSFAVGVTRLVLTKDFDKLSAEVIISLCVLIVSYPVIEGMTVRLRIESGNTVWSLCRIGSTRDKRRTYKKNKGGK